MSEWQRSHWSAGGGDAFLYYGVFGQVPDTWEISSSTYRTHGLPDGIEVRGFYREQHAEYLAGLTDGYAWDQFVATEPILAKGVSTAPACLVLAGSVSDPSDLGYLRDTVGVVTFLLDHGGVSVFDLQTATWFSPDLWGDQIFRPAAPVPRNHAVILVSSEETSSELSWFHTRGLRKFGRPDISVHDVPRHQWSAVEDLCNRFIEYQAFGGLVPEGQEIRVQGLPPGGVVAHGGDLEDLDFNNVHFEVKWSAA